MVPPPPDGSYYHFQLIDMEVYTVSGELLGEVTEILDVGPNDVYVVTNDGAGGPCARSGRGSPGRERRVRPHDRQPPRGAPLEA